MRPSQGGAAGFRAPTSKMLGPVKQPMGAPVAGFAAEDPSQPGK